MHHSRLQLEKFKKNLFNFKSQNIGVQCKTIGTSKKTMDVFLQKSVKLVITFKDKNKDFLLFCVLNVLFSNERIFRKTLN